MPDGRVITSNSENKPASKKSDSRNIEQIKEAASEVRELIRQSKELDELEKTLERIGYSEWVNNGDRDRFYLILKNLNSGAENARVYWEERNLSVHNARKMRRRDDDGFTP
ncbi:hypothetical protein D0894_15685 [Pseudomonas monteilii]|uniref:Uncharacterized protein n=2 Tax=Pseudomonas monteilii TaxID=76759 RepID=A0A399M489_9PSED|nr:hypothetical protein D0894_15685 [Pseudomonas monteilii]